MKLHKMHHEAVACGDQWKFEYQLGDQPLNELVGNSISLKFSGRINCIACDRKVSKTFNQGYCFPCFRSLARCDSCIVRPELCHFSEGSCREPEWGQQHCLIEHVVYLANTTGLKVGVTGGHKTFERWGDQGALHATVVARVPERLLAGKIEQSLKSALNDKTDWRRLLKGQGADVDFAEAYQKVKEQLPEEYVSYLLPESEVLSGIQSFVFPVESYCEKAVTWNLDKTPVVEGILSGIRGQYLFIDGKGLNIRKYQGYHVSLNC